MKRIFTLCIALCAVITGFAQTDTTGTNKAPEGDTIRIGGMIIIRKPGSKEREIVHDKEYKMRNRRGDKPSNISTNWWIVDLGFANYNDKSNYTTAASDGFTGPGVGKDQMKLKAGKSRNVNLWFFMQKFNIASHVVNFKYGLGLELNNYHFDDNIVFAKNPTYITLGTEDIKKIKLAADYLTVPFMLNFDFTPKRRKGFGISGGISAGYLYSARYKTKDGGDVKKVKDDFNLERFKLSYIGELSLGPVRLYGSYAMKNMWDKSLDMTPYNFGFRLSNW
jgi:Outer membrane protein beta-barrel domain